VRGVIAGTERFSTRVIEGAPALRIISRVGVDFIDLDAAREHGIRVFTTPDARVRAVTEHTLTIIQGDVLKGVASKERGVLK
jgi:lactate dehydrogenase-like 2-hydroxyacid dehydrogenase